MEKLLNFTQVHENLYSQHGTQFFYSFERSNIFVEKMYQLKNFDMNFKGRHLGCLLITPNLEFIL